MSTTAAAAPPPAFQFPVPATLKRRSDCLDHHHVAVLVAETAIPTTVDCINTSSISFSPSSLTTTNISYDIILNATPNSHSNQNNEPHHQQQQHSKDSTDSCPSIASANEEKDDHHNHNSDSCDHHDSDSDDDFDSDLDSVEDEQETQMVKNLVQQTLFSHRSLSCANMAQLGASFFSQQQQQTSRATPTSSKLQSVIWPPISKKPKLQGQFGGPASTMLMLQQQQQKQSMMMLNNPFLSSLYGPPPTTTGATTATPATRLASPSTKPNANHNNNLANTASCSVKKRAILMMSESAPCLTPHPTTNTHSLSPRQQQNSNMQNKHFQKQQQPPLQPEEFLKIMSNKAGTSSRQYSYNSPQCSSGGGTSKSFFYQHTKKDKDDYDMQVVQAVRNQDVAALQTLYQQHGRSLQCVNAFGETILHIAARRGAVQVLEYLIKGEPQVNVRVCCENGRTPLHDACWSASNNLQVAQLLLDACPDLLYITDKRGHGPLKFLHKEHWSAWIQFLQQQGSKRLAPKELV